MGNITEVFYFVSLLFMAFLVFSSRLLSNGLGHFHRTVFGRKYLDHFLKKLTLYSFYSSNQNNKTSNILCSYVSAQLKVQHFQWEDSREFWLYFTGVFADLEIISALKEVLMVKHIHKSKFNNRTKGQPHCQTEKK